MVNRCAHRGNLVCLKRRGHANYNGLFNNDIKLDYDFYLKSASSLSQAETDSIITFLEAAAESNNEAARKPSQKCASMGKRASTSPILVICGEHSLPGLSRYSKLLIQLLFDIFTQRMR
jgi:hypothetical protein